MNVRKVITSYRIQYPEPIELEPGDEVKLGPEEQEEKWKGWIWAETSDRKGWVPMQVLEISADRTKARVVKSYTARELDADAGDSVEIISGLNGWSFCRNLSTGLEGWLPDEVLMSDKG